MGLKNTTVLSKTDAQAAQQTFDEALASEKVLCCVLGSSKRASDTVATADQVAANPSDVRPFGVVWIVKPAFVKDTLNKFQPAKPQVPSIRQGKVTAFFLTVSGRIGDVISDTDDDDDLRIYQGFATAAYLGGVK